MNIPAFNSPEVSQEELISAYHQGIKEAVDFVQTEVIPVLNGQLNLNKWESAIVGTFYRIHSLASSLTHLNKPFDFNSVAIICRSIYELLLDLKILTAEDFKEDDLKRFHAFPRIKRFHAAHKLVEFQNINPDVKKYSFFEGEIREKFVKDPGRQESIFAQVCELWGERANGQPNWPNHWYGVDIRQRAAKFGKIYEQEYLEIYSVLSWYTHSGSISYADFSPKTLEGIYGIALDISRKMYVESLIICAKTFSLFDAIGSFAQVVEFLKNAPSEILIQTKLNEFSI